MSNLLKNFKSNTSPVFMAKVLNKSIKLPLNLCLGLNLGLHTAWGIPYAIVRFKIWSFLVFFLRLRIQLVTACSRKVLSLSLYISSMGSPIAGFPSNSSNQINCVSISLKRVSGSTTSQWKQMRSELGRMYLTGIWRCPQIVPNAKNI